MEKMYAIMGNANASTWISALATNRKTAELVAELSELNKGEAQRYYTIELCPVIWKSTDNKWIEEQIKLLRNY